MRKASGRALALGAALMVATGLPALADVVVPYDDGAAHNGNCDVTNPHIEVVNADDAQGGARIDCGTSNDTRIIKVKLAEKTGTDTYRDFLIREWDVNAGNTRHDDVLTPVNTSCGPGTGVYVAIIQVKKQGGTFDIDRSQDVTLPISGCL